MHQTVRSSLQAMKHWPEQWAVEDADLPIGRHIVAQMEDFVRHLHASGLAASTIRRHMDHLHLLGGTLIHDRHYDNPPAEVPALALAVDDEGGPLVDRGETPRQKAFDASCRKLHKFLNQPEGAQATGKRRRPKAPIRLEAMLEEAFATIESPDDEAEALLEMLHAAIDLPFTTSILGVDVQVVDFEMDIYGQLLAFCQRAGIPQRIPLEDLPLPKPAPHGSEWIAVYRHWRLGS